MAREVGTEGKLGGQARRARRRGHLEGSHRQREQHGVEPDRSRCANVSKVGDRGRQRRPLAEESRSRSRARSSRSKNIDQPAWSTRLNTFASEVTRVAREVGTEGKLGGLADVPSVAGTWKDLTDNVNNMASNLTDQVRNIALVTTAIANGDLSKKITVDVKGELLELKNTINTTVDQLRSFAAEVTRVARARWAPTASSAVRRDVPGVAGDLEGPHRQRQQHGVQPHDPGARHRQGRRPRSRTATCRNDWWSRRRARSPSSPTPSTT